ncbi:hypothetical protein [Halosimplex amylolyticum]|uniref:hypothetical protein n=1 Tax=Halosimplex amylolyticum TaxID=3396616 RepID=UPI003F562E55
MTVGGPAEAPGFRHVPREGIDRYRLVDPPRSVGPRRVAPVSTDRSVWLYAGEGTPTLGVLDVETGAFRPAMETTPGGPTPWVDVESETAYVLDGHAVTAHDTERPADPRSVGRFDTAVVPGTPVAGLTRSADGEQLGAVFATDDESRLAALSVEEGTTAVWHTRDRRYDTLRFSPSDASLTLLARGAADGVGGEAWLAREGLGARPLAKLLPDHHGDLRWNEGGTGLWFVEPGRGAGLLHLEAGRRERVWGTPVRAADATRDGDLLAGTVPDSESVRVAVYDRRGDREQVVSDPIPGNNAWTPRPQFVCGDRWLLYTATVAGDPRVTLVPVDALR